MHVVGWKGPSSPIRDESEIGSLEVLWVGLLGAGICMHLQAGGRRPRPRSGNNNNNSSRAQAQKERVASPLTMAAVPCWT